MSQIIYCMQVQACSQQLQVRFAAKPFDIRFFVTIGSCDVTNGYTAMRASQAASPVCHYACD